DSGVSVLRFQFRGALHFWALPRRHLVWFQLSDAEFDCRRGFRRARQRASAGALAICPAGIDCAADTEESGGGIPISVHPAHLSLAAAEESAPDVRLRESLLTFDQELLGLVTTLAGESARGYPDGPLFWNAVANNFVAGLIARHSSCPDAEVRGRLSKAVL